MAKFVMKEISAKLYAGENRLYPQLIRLGNISTDELAKMISERTGNAPSDVKGVLEAISMVAAQQMAMGFSVQLKGIGIISPKLGLKAGVEPEKVEAETKRNGASIEVVGINFRADKSLVLETQERIHLQRVTTTPKDKPTTTLEEQLEMALKYIEKMAFSTSGTIPR